MQNAPQSYLVTEVMTAAPQKLQLMLIEAAIRAAQRARQHWQAQEDLQASECLIRAQEIVGEILSALNYEVKSELVKKVAGVYLFLNRTLLDASLTRDINKLDEALRVLSVERETWRQVCEKLAGSPDDQSLPENAALPPAPNHFISGTTNSDSPAASLSLEA